MWAANRCHNLEASRLKSTTKGPPLRYIYHYILSVPQSVR